MRSYDVYRGTVHLLIMHRHRNYRTVYKGKSMGHVSRKPDLVLHLIGVIWICFGVNICTELTLVGSKIRHFLQEHSLSFRQRLRLD